jgi:hypothetical protein
LGIDGFADFSFRNAVGGFLFANPIAVGMDIDSSLEKELLLRKAEGLQAFRAQ